MNAPRLEGIGQPALICAIRIIIACMQLIGKLCWSMSIPTQISVPAHRKSPLVAIWGALLADALGAPFEFKSSDQIPVASSISLVMPREYQKTYAAIPYGTWSDDASQLLCLLDSLSQGKGQLDLEDFGLRLLAWRDTGLHQAGGVVYDCGGQTRLALDRLSRGASAALAGISPNSRAAGNGSLMRVLPSALAPELWGISSADAVAIGMRQSLVTHSNALSIVTCGMYTQLARLLIERAACPSAGGWYAWVADAALLLREHPDMTAEYRVALDVVLAFGRNAMPTGSGYVVDTLWSAILALRNASDFLGAVRNAILMGQDTDTTACVTGGLAALAWGVGSVPADWWSQLRVPAESALLLRSLPAA